MREISLTINLVDPRPDKPLPERYVHVTKSLLDVLKVWELTGTFFCDGEVAQDNPELIQRIANQGHEVALHSLNNVPLTKLSANQFKVDTQKAKTILEDLAQKKVIGYRAPFFSLTEKSLWAPEILNELGFLYSSSVLPAKHTMFGMPQAPEHPFKWPSGLIEIPVPIAQIGFMRMPYLGGAYFRYLPSIMINNALRKNSAENTWFYCHPYDLDSVQQFYRMKDRSFLTSVWLWLNRKSTIDKMRKIYQDSQQKISSHSFASQIESGAYNELQTFYI